MQSGIFFADGAGVVQPVLFSGSTVEIAAGDSRIVEYVVDWRVLPGLEARRVFSDAGEFTFAVHFTDGTDALVVAHLRQAPACGIGGELALLVPFASWLHRRRGYRCAVR